MIYNEIIEKINSLFLGDRIPHSVSIEFLHDAQAQPHLRKKTLNHCIIFHTFVLFRKCPREMKTNPYCTTLCIEFNAAMVVVLRSLFPALLPSRRDIMRNRESAVWAELRAAYKRIQMDPHSECFILSIR